MQILIQALCTKGPSMRQAIADDSRLDRYKLQVTKEAQPGRAPGWLKLHGEEIRAQRARRHARVAEAEPDRRRVRELSAPAL